MDSWLIGGALILGLLVGAAAILIFMQKPAMVIQNTATTNTKKAENMEQWSWTDYKGRERSVSVKREVKAYE